MSTYGEMLEELRRKRLALIERFLEENQDVLGLNDVEKEDGAGPHVITGWCLIMLARDLGSDEYDPTENIISFFGPGMTYSQKLGMLATADEMLRTPALYEADE